MEVDCGGESFDGTEWGFRWEVDSFLGRGSSPQEFQLQAGQGAETVPLGEPPYSHGNTASEQFSGAVVLVELPSSGCFRGSRAIREHV